jgi:hypothetical protein
MKAVIESSIARYQNGMPMYYYGRDIKSSVIRRVSYSVITRRLFIDFHNDKAYAYDAPIVEFAALVTAESIGAYFSKNIRGKYEYTVIA